MKETGGFLMASKVVSAAGSLFSGALQSVGVESMIDKVTELVDVNIRDPHLIKSIEEQLNSKYGNDTFYNDFCAYINENRTIERVIEMFYNIKAAGIISPKKFVEENLNAFSSTYKAYSPYDYSFVRDAFDLIFEEVFSKVLCFNVHSDMGKLQASEAMWFGQISEGQASQTELLQSINTNVSRLVNASTMMNPVKDDFDQTSEKVADFLKKIDSVGDKDNPVADSENALLRYQELSTEALIVLRGENEIQVDKVICAINCHMAICYGNLGIVEKAFECLRRISPVTAEESKLYQFVNAVLIVNLGLEEKYMEAERCLNRALEIDSNHRRAYLVRQYLMALLASASLEEILRPLDEYFEKILSEDKERELIADYYIYRGFICKEFKEYDLAEKDFISAKEFGYDDVVVDYNLAVLYYGMATRELPKDTRIFCIGVDVSIIKKAVELLRRWLVEKTGEKFPTYIKARMVGVYASSCVLLGIKHELTPIDEYLKLPNLEYEVQRMLIMGADNVTDKTTLGILDKDDELYARIVNKVNENRYSDVKKLLLLMSEEEKKELPVTTIYLILQASICNKDLETYHDFRKYITRMDAIGLIECIDAYAKEESGEIEAAKNILDKYATASNDYHLLRNIVCFYARNNYDVACEQLLVRILDLLKGEKVYIDDKHDFYRNAINFLVSHKSEYAKNYVDAIDIESEQVWRAKAYYYDEINDIPRLLEMMTLLYQSTRDFSMGYNEIVCFMKMMEYDTALMKATELLTTVHENNIKDRIQVIWMISNLYLFLGQNMESFEWAKQAHELTLDTPSNVSHGAYLARATRVGRAGEALASLVEYKEQHPVVISEWMKEVKLPEDSSGEGLLLALENAVGQSHGEYAQKEKEFAILYRKGVLPNSTILKRHGKDIAQLFIFASKNKLRISRGNWASIEEKKALIGEHILVDSITLIIMQRYGCLDAIKKIKNVHISYSTLVALQEIYPTLNYYYVEPILEWIRQADNIIFEADGYCKDDSMTKFFSDELLTCCGLATKLEIPFVTSEVLLEDLVTIEECQLPKGLQMISIVALCFATMGSEPNELSQMLYNLLEECTFINFTSQTIIEQIKKNDYIISKCDLNRFFICNTTCDMISFANVYIGVIKTLKDQYYDVSLDFSRLVLENAMRIWRKGTHYRAMSRQYASKSDTAKVKSISTYLICLVKGIQNVYGSIPSEIEELLDGVMKKGIHDFGQIVFSEMVGAL